VAVYSTARPPIDWSPYCAQCETRVATAWSYDDAKACDVWSFRCHGRDGEVVADRRAGWRPVLPPWVFEGRRPRGWRPRCGICTKDVMRPVRVSALCREASLGMVEWIAECHGARTRIRLYRDRLANLGPHENELDLLPETVSSWSAVRSADEIRSKYAADENPFVGIGRGTAPPTFTAKKIAERGARADEATPDRPREYERIEPKNHTALRVKHLDFFDDDDSER